MKNALLILCLAAYTVVYSQERTVGLLSYQPEKSYDGYNLLYPHNQSDVYLLDNCGRIVHQWDDEGVVPGNSAYLTDQGNLVKCKRRTTSAVNDPIWAGGGGESVEIRNWDNELLADYQLNNESYRLHHDIAVMPNGNILMIAWQNNSLEEALSAGRNPALMAQDKVWSETILEWDPQQDSIIWQWNAWDHLIQDFDAEKANFGVVSDHPEKIDLNYDEHDGHPDWLHINAIDYNSALDQIMLSVPYFNEFWIIDHSTSTAEAASSEGGTSGLGGDLLYRWGNPIAYRQGEAGDKQLFFQHDTHWANPASANSMVVLFNNRLPSDESSSNALTLPWDDRTKTYMKDGSTFGPSGFDVIVEHPVADEIRSFSNSLSSAQVLDNGNYLICAGRWGYTYELTPENEIVWEYVTPLVAGDPATQGDTLYINNNITFRVKRYNEDYGAFANRDLTGSEYIELNPDTAFCNMVISDISTPFYVNTTVYPNPTSGAVYIESEELVDEPIRIFDVLGRKRLELTMRESLLVFDLTELESGIYTIMGRGGLISRILKL